MPYVCVRPTIPQCRKSLLICVLAMVIGIGGIGFLSLAVPAWAEQAVQQPVASGEPSSQDPKHTSERLKQVEGELEKLKTEQQRERLEREKYVKEQRAKEKKWETKFDLLRRDPRARLEGTGTQHGWIHLKDFESDVRFGGFFQMNLIHNFQETTNKLGKFQTGKFPVPTGKTTSTEFDVRTTRLVLETRTPTRVGDYSTFVSIDFFANNSPGTVEPRLRQGYLTGVGVFTGTSFLVGQAFSTFRDTQAFPEMFDLEGPNGWSRLFNGMFRSSIHLDQDNHWMASVAIEDPDSDVSNGNGQSELPDLVTRMDYNGGLVHVMTAFVGRQLKATDTTGSGTDRTFAYGFNVSGKLGISNSRDSFKFQGYYGLGIGRYINDLDAVGGQDAVYDNTKGTLNRLESYGGFGGYQHWWTDRLRSTMVGGYVKVNNLAIQAGNAFSDSIYALGNLIYSPFKHYDIGLEYSWGQRKNKDDQSGHANRLMLAFKWHY